MIEKNWQELQKPEKISVNSSEYNPRQAVITVSPLERGFGITLGNSLRRILLSSLQALRSLRCKFKALCTNSHLLLVFAKT